jgi:prephenate dehydrogenase
MNWAEMVVLIVLIGTIGKMFSSRRRDKGIGTDIIQADPDSARMREEIKMLKDRIAVLERITTDNNSATALDREIEKLR